MLAEVLRPLVDALGLSTGQLGLAVSLVAIAVWMRRAMVLGSLAAHGVQVVSALAVLLGLGVVTGIIGIDFAAAIEVGGAIVDVVVGLGKWLWRTAG
jgi:hypothetical protein